MILKQIQTDSSYQSKFLSIFKSRYKTFSYSISSSKFNHCVLINYKDSKKRMKKC